MNRSNQQTPTRPAKELQAGHAPNTLCRMATQGNTERRVLVVDDEPSVADSISQILALDNYKVEVANSAQEALNAFKKARFDLIIVDYKMPEMKGDKLAATIKSLAPQQPILMITAYGEALRFAGNFPLGVDLIVNKPFALEELRDAVRRLANRT